MCEETSKECLQYSDWPTRLNTMEVDSHDKLYLLPNLYEHQSADITTVCAGRSDSSAATWLLKRVMIFIFLYISLDNFVTLIAVTACILEIWREISGSRCGDYNAMPCHVVWSKRTVILHEPASSVIRQMKGIPHPYDRQQLVFRLHSSMFQTVLIFMLEDSLFPVSVLNFKHCVEQYCLNFKGYLVAQVMNDFLHRGLL